MGIFDSTSNSDQTTTSQNAGFSEIGGNANSFNLSLGKKSKGNTFNVLDGGAISRAFDFGGAALKSVEVLGASNSASIDKALAALNESARSDSENVLVTVGKWAAIAAIAYFGFRALARG